MMNNQEYGPPNQQPMYNDPRGQGGYSPQSPQQFNDDPREQPLQGAIPEQMYGEKLQPQRRKRRGPRGCIIAVVATLILLSLIGAGIGFTKHRATYAPH